MKLVSDDSRIITPMLTIGHIRHVATLMKIGENILESSETNFMNLPPYVFDVDYVAKIRSELSITVLEEKNEQNSRSKKVTLVKEFLMKFLGLVFVRYW